MANLGRSFSRQSRYQTDSAKVPSLGVRLGLEIVGRHLAGPAILYQLVGDLLAIIQAT